MAAGRRRGRGTGRTAPCGGVGEGRCAHVSMVRSGTQGRHRSGELSREDPRSTRSHLGRLAERAEPAERFGLRLFHANAVAVARAPASYDEGDPVPRQVEQALISPFGDRSILLTAENGRLPRIAPGHQDEGLTYFAEQAHVATTAARSPSAAAPDKAREAPPPSCEKPSTPLNSSSASASTTRSFAPPTCRSTRSSPDRVGVLASSRPRGGLRSSNRRGLRQARVRSPTRPSTREARRDRRCHAAMPCHGTCRGVRSVGGGVA